jgi:hypothetical protein
MERVAVRLVIDYGSASARAMLGWNDGTLATISLDGQPELPAGVYVDESGTLYVGGDALQRGIADPARFVAEPALQLGSSTVELAGGTVPVVDLVAAALHRIHQEALRITGAPIPDVQILAAPDWGPQRLNRIRRAAHDAGLTTVTFVPAPIAALRAAGHADDAANVLVCDLGGTGQAIIMNSVAGVPEVIANIRDVRAGGAECDRLIAAWIHQTDPAQPNAAALASLATARTVKEALSAAPAAAIPASGERPAVVLSAADLEPVLAPVRDALGDLVTRTVTGAELTPADIESVVCIGAGAANPTLVDAVRAATPAPLTVIDNPDTATLRACMAGAAAIETPPPPAPPYWRVVAILVPGVASIALVVHVLITAIPMTGYTIVTWGELALAATFALLTCLAAATILAAALPAPTASQATPPMASALLAAAAIAVSVIGLYAIAGSLYLNLPIGPFLRWTLLPNLGILLAVVLLALVTARTSRAPRAGWHAVLQFPIASTITAALGMILIEIWLTTPIYNDQRIAYDILGRSGGALVMIGATLAVVRHLAWRIIVGAPMAVFGAALAGVHSTGYLAGVYIVATTVWWGRHTWRHGASALRS